MIYLFWQFFVYALFTTSFQKVINNLMESGIKIFAWTVNNPADMDKFLQFGIDGIITDSPDILIKKIAINPEGK